MVVLMIERTADGWVWTDHTGASGPVDPAGRRRGLTAWFVLRRYPDPPDRIVYTYDAVSLPVYDPPPPVREVKTKWTGAPLPGWKSLGARAKQGRVEG